MSAIRSIQFRGHVSWRTAVIWIGVVVFSVMLFAELEIDRRAIESSGSMVAFAMLWGVRLAYDHRRSERLVMLAWGIVTAIGFVAWYAGVILLSRTFGPSIRAQEWVPPVLVGLAAVGAIGVFVGSVVRESTRDGRAIAIGEGVGLCLVPLGFWLVVTGPNELLNSVGAGLAIAGPVILYWLQRERRRRGLEHGAAS